MCFPSRRATIVLGEAITPSSILATVAEPIGEGLGSISALAGIVALGLGEWYVYANYIKGREGPTIKIAGRPVNRGKPDDQQQAGEA